jgi:outer membrane protein TolC
MADQALVQATQNLATVLGQINITIGKSLPQAASAVSPTATGGSEALPSQPAGFLLIELSGSAYKIPLYNP